LFLSWRWIIVSLLTPSVISDSRLINEEVIGRMRTRIERTRKIISIAHDPRMIRMLEGLIAQAEADIARLEADRGAEVIPIGIKDRPSQA
jgi:hypothetical protein